MSQITLQVTQSCNLRCDYCAYSRKYSHRVHSGKQMTFEIARDSVDFLIKHSKDLEDIAVGFYGGEPLLNFELIKKIIFYIENEYPFKKLAYHMTINGTLLNKENLKFLEEKKFKLMISIDAPKDIHNANR